MAMTQGYQIVSMGEQSLECEVLKQHMYDDFSDASESFVQYIEEETGVRIQRPRKVSDASTQINNVLFQIWRVEYQSV